MTILYVLDEPLRARCSAALARCAAFETHATLRDVFAAGVLMPWQVGLPERGSVSARVAGTLAYGLAHAVGARPLLSVLCEVLAAEVAEGDGLRVELGALTKAAAQLRTYAEVYADGELEWSEEEKRQRATYLEHVVAQYRVLQLVGIRAPAGKEVGTIELERIYITLRSTKTASVARAAQKGAGGEREELRAERGAYRDTVAVEEALAVHKHLVVLGAPGAGKTTLLRFLALQYARDAARGAQGADVYARLGLSEPGVVPVLIALRDFEAYLREKHPTLDGLDGHGRLLDFIRAHFQGKRLALPERWLDVDLPYGRVAFFFDGLDEAGTPELRRRIARMVDEFAQRYAQCRIVVTSRIAGYDGAARVGADFATTTIRDFTLADIETFVGHWQRQVAEYRLGAGVEAEREAEVRGADLLAALHANARVRELAVNPLLLTVIALVHRQDARLPDRRVDLYARAVEALLGAWDVAKGLPGDATGRRLVLQDIAFVMHQAQSKTIEVGDLRAKLVARYADKAERFLEVMRERTGLLIEAGPGEYRFSHLTFQEYLAALAMLDLEDYTDYALTKIGDAWWREVLLLAAGHLCTQGASRATRFIRALADCPREPEAYHNLVLAAECVRDAGENGVEAGLAQDLQARLEKVIAEPLPARAKEDVRAWIVRRVAAADALGRIESGQYGTGSAYWRAPWGEPVWVRIPAGEFWMGSESEDSNRNERPVHRVYVPEFYIARVPITNAQYALYVQDAQVKLPKHWKGGTVPKGLENHPVVYMSWNDAQAYCVWLGAKLGKTMRLPSEAEWEKAARGSADRREWPWGDLFSAERCNTDELGLGETTPVGVFRSGASPYGVLDLVGNVWEWCADWYEAYPGGDPWVSEDFGRRFRVVRGGTWYYDYRVARCACRGWSRPNGFLSEGGFRVVCPGSISG